MRENDAFLLLSKFSQFRTHACFAIEKSRMCCGLKFNVVSVNVIDGSCPNHFVLHPNPLVSRPIEKTYVPFAVNSIVIENAVIDNTSHPIKKPSLPIFWRFDFLDNLRDKFLGS